MRNNKQSNFCVSTLLWVYWDSKFIWSWKISILKLLQICWKSGSEYTSAEVGPVCLADFSPTFIFFYKAIFQFGPTIGRLFFFINRYFWLANKTHVPLFFVKFYISSRFGLLTVWFQIFFELPTLGRLFFFFETWFFGNFGGPPLWPTFFFFWADFRVCVPGRPW